MTLEPKMKKPWLAFLLNLLLAGAGFGYLGKWAWAVLDFFVTIGVGLLVLHFYPDSVYMVSTVMPVVNGSLAMSVARSMNVQPPPQPLTPTGQ
jgi:hypothetical protein